MFIFDKSLKEGTEIEFKVKLADDGDLMVSNHGVLLYYISKKNGFMHIMRLSKEDERKIDSRIKLDFAVQCSHEKWASLF